MWRGVKKPLSQRKSGRGWRFLSKCTIWGGQKFHFLSDWIGIHSLHTSNYWLSVPDRQWIAMEFHWCERGLNILYMMTPWELDLCPSDAHCDNHQSSNATLQLFIFAIEWKLFYIMYLCYMHSTGDQSRAPVKALLSINHRMQHATSLSLLLNENYFT